MLTVTELLRAIDACCGKRGPYCEACQARLGDLKAHAAALGQRLAEGQRLLDSVKPPSDA